MTEDRPFAVGFVPDRWEGGIASLGHDAEYVYFRLCRAMWATGEGVHVDDAHAACRFHPKFKAALATLERAGKIRREGDLLVNGRALEEHARAAQNSDANKRRGKRGGRPSQGSQPGSDSTSDSPVTQQSLPPVTQTHPNPNPLTTSNEVVTPCSPPPGRRRGKHALPSDFEPQHRIAEREGRTLEWSRRQFERMTNWALSNDVRKADWQRTFDNWCLKAIDGDGGRGPPLQADPDEVDRLLAEKANAH